ncbi:MAG: DUF6671 family protein [Fluviicola sp.]
MFRGRHITIATKHGKEKALAPLVSTLLQAIPKTFDQLDTDQFGTFSGETERTGSPIEVLRAKTRLAQELCGDRRFIVSEGSFGPHPASPFITANEEWLLYTDFDLNHEVLVRSLSVETNYKQHAVKSIQELEQVIQSTDFPNNGLILIAKEQGEIREVIKDLVDTEALIASYAAFNNRYNDIIVQTDMRAHKNTLRMKHIELTAIKLINRMLSTCPACHFPGFGAVSADKGLPCKYCQAPTNAILAENWSCSNCQYTTKKFFPDGLKYADPGICSFCNP